MATGEHAQAKKPAARRGRSAAPTRERLLDAAERLFAERGTDNVTLLDITQAEVAAAVGMSRAHIAGIESGRVNPSLEIVDRMGAALGLELQLVGRGPIVLNGPIQRDAVHAWCSGYVGRRLGRSGFDVGRGPVVPGGATRCQTERRAHTRIPRAESSPVS